MASIDAAADEERARRYARDRLSLSVSSWVADAAVLLWLLLSGFTWKLSGWAGAGARSHAWLQVLLYGVYLGVLLKAVALPFELVSRAIEVRYELNRQRWRGWIADELKGAALGAGLGLAALECMYALLRAAPAHWWLWTWAIFTGFVVILAQLAPVLLLPLFFKFRPLSSDGEEGELVRRLARRAERAGARIRGIFEWKLGEKSVKANAALTGWGSTRRVIISDTLLSSAQPDEIEAVFAHELGHHVRRHIWRGLLFQAALSLLGFWIAAVLLRDLGRGIGMHSVADVAGLPLLLLIATVLGVLLMPVANAFTRQMEREADDYAFAAMGTADPLVSGLERLATGNLAERRPPRWKELLLYSHPSIATRVARARAWEAAHAAGRGPE
jgi:STE24 endopeptidase